VSKSIDTIMTESSRTIIRQALEEYAERKGASPVPVSATGPLLVTKSGLSQALSVSERTIDYWREKELIPFLQFGSRFVRFDLAEVISALSKRYKVRPAAQPKARRAK
jgi:hypothetical protein